MTMATNAGAQDTDDDDPITVLPDIRIIGVSPVQGTGVDIDQVPSNVQTLGAEDFERLQPIDLTDLLNQSIGSASAVDVQNNPFQRNVNFRGFTASPLLGEAQGLAVYQNGVRINEPFGDTLQWDLVPEVAIDRVELHTANPVFGLNALGGALALGLKDGFSFQGAAAEASGGYFGRYNFNGELGVGNENFAGYIAAETANDDGWRNESPSELHRLYADGAFIGEQASANVNFVYANTDLNGNGLTPIELLESNRRAVFTFPDNTQNELMLASASGNYDLNDAVSFQSNGYFRKLIRTTLNADEAEAENCELPAGTLNAADPFVGEIGNGLAVALANGDGFICEEEDSAEFLLDQNGNAIASFADFYGALNTSSTITKGFGFGLQGTVDDTLLGYDNQLVVGGAVDIGLTRFHNESFIGTLTLDRTVLQAPGSEIINFASIENTEAEIEAGEAIATRVETKNSYYGLYVSDTFHFDENLAFTVGGRFNFARIELTDQFSSFFELERESDLNGSHRFRRFNPAAGMTYSIPGWNTTYFMGYSETNRAPTPAELTCADPNAPCRLPNSFVADPPIKQVISRTIEAGLRGNMPADWLGGVSSLDWSVSAFSTSNKNDIIFVSAGPFLGSGFFQNISKTRRRGVEVGVGGQAGSVSWFANYSFIEATFDSPFSVNSPNHPLAVAGEIQVKPGDDIPGVPQHNFKTGFSIEILDGWSVGANLIAASGVYLRGDEANLLDRTDGYAVVDLQTAYAINDWVEIFGFIDNVFDTDYETFGVLGEAEGADGAVPIHELPGGVTDPRFLSPGQPFGAFVGVRVRLN